MENKNNFQKILQFLQLKIISKRKYLLSSIFVFAVVVTLFLPAQSAQACSFWEVGCKIKEAATGALVDLVSGVLYFLAAAALYLLSYLVSFGAWLIDVMLEPKLYNTVLKFTTPPATPSTIQLGWQTIRDMSNMFFVFILLLIAFSTILRIQQYSAKNLMIKFITALFLINFSAVIAGIVIDFGQIFMYELRSWMGTFGGSGGSGGDLTSIVDITLRNKYPFWTPPEGGLSLENAMGATFAAIFALVLGLVYIMLAGFLLIRVIMFAFLIILSPLAFLGIVMPGLGSESREWWDKLFKYSLFGPVFMFFVYLSSNMASSLKNYDIATAEPDLGGLAFVGALVVKFAIPLGMLLMVIPVTKKLGGFGADKLVGGALGIGKIALGTYAGIKLAGKGASRIGSEAATRSEKVGRMQDWGRRQKEGILKKIPFGKGAIMRDQAKYQKTQDDRMKKKREENGDPKHANAEIALDVALGKMSNLSGAPTNEDKAYAAEALAAQGKLGDPKYASDIEKLMPAIERALSPKDLKALTDKNVNLELYTRAGKENIEKYRNEENPDTKKPYTEQEAQEKVLKDKMADINERGEAHKVQNLSNPLAAKVWDNELSSSQKESAFNRMTKEQRKALSEGYMANAKPPEEYKKLEESLDNAKKAGNKEEEAKANKQLSSDLDYRTNAVKLGKDIEEAFKSCGRSAEENIKKVFSQFSTKNIAALSTNDQLKYGYMINDSQRGNLNKANEYEAINNITLSINNRLEDKTLTLSDEEKKELETKKKRIENMLKGKKNKKEKEEEEED